MNCILLSASVGRCMDTQSACHLPVRTVAWPVHSGTSRCAEQHSSRQHCAEQHSCRQHCAEQHSSRQHCAHQHTALLQVAQLGITTYH